MRKAESRLAHSIDSSAVAGCDGTHYGTNPKLSNEPLFANDNYLSFDFPCIGSVWRRLGMAGAEGLRGNEA